jgi:hypothetical protein
MRFDTALLKRGAFWAMVLIAWMTLAAIVYPYSRVASVMIAIGWIVFLCFLFDRILPSARK